MLQCFYNCKVHFFLYCHNIRNIPGAQKLVAVRGTVKRRQKDQKGGQVGGREEEKHCIF